MKTSAVRFLQALPLLIFVPVAIFFSALALALTDFFWMLFGRRCAPKNEMPATSAASLVIPNWNGRELLERFLPSWVAAIEGHPGSEIIVVDNGSTDGSAEWVRSHHPQVRVLALPRNLGFGGGSNAGFRE